MSAASLRATELRPARSRRLPKLQIVRSPGGQRSMVPFAALCLAILVGALVGALMLNTSMAATSYQMSEQRAELARLSEQTQILSTQVDQMASPANLAAAAADLGMQRAEEPSYLTLADGSIYGPAAALIGGE